MMQAALQYPCPFLLTMGVQTQDATSMKSLVTANQLRAQQNAESSRAKVMPDVGEKLKDWRGAARAIDQGGGVLWVDLDRRMRFEFRAINGSRTCAPQVITGFNEVMGS